MSESTVPLIVAHRGASGLEPENTLRSFRRAEELGADALELDLRVTRDAHLVDVHDPNVDRVTNGSGMVASMTLSELRRLDAGLGEQIPTFEEVLHSTALPIHAELKTAEAVEPLVQLLSEQDGFDRVTTMSFDSAMVRQVKYDAPDASVGLISWSWSENVVRSAHSVGASLVSLWWDTVSREVVERCREVCLRVCVWTVNDPGEMRRLIDVGVDAIVTDRPDLLVQVLESR